LKQQQLQFKDTKMLPECVQLKDFFNVQLGSRKWTLKKLDSQPGSIFQKAVADTLQACGYEVMLGVQAMHCSNYSIAFNLSSPKITLNHARYLQAIGPWASTSPRVALLITTCDVKPVIMLMDCHP